MRSEEVMALDGAISEKQLALDGANAALQKAQTQLSKMRGAKELIESETWKYDQSEWSLPDPPALMSAKAYKEKCAHPLLMKMKHALRAAVSRYHTLVGKLNGLQKALDKAENAVYNLTESVREEREITTVLKEKLQDYKLLRRFFGEEKTDGILEQARTDFEAHRRAQHMRNREYER